jgi:hypothetical protein
LSTDTASKALSPGQQMPAMLGRHHAVLSWLQLVDGALSELSGLLALSGLPVTLTPQYARPVAGFTLEVRPAAAACTTSMSPTTCIAAF